MTKGEYIYIQQGQNEGEKSEVLVLVLGAKFTRVPETLIIKINNIECNI